MEGRQSLEMQATCEGGSTRLTVQGELDLETAPRFEARLRALRAKKDVVRLDLSKLEFMDAFGLRAVRRALRDRRAGISTLEVDPKLSPEVSRVLGLAGCTGLSG